MFLHIKPAGIIFCVMLFTSSLFFNSCGKGSSGKNNGGILPDVEFSLPAGTYYAVQVLNITCPEPGTSIKYTIDNSDPKISATAIDGSSLDITVNTAVKAYAYKKGMTDSEVSSSEYILKTAAPAISPDSGTYYTDQTVTLSSPDATIYYTVNGDTPDTSLAGHSSPVEVPVAGHGTNITINAIAVKDSWNVSDIVSRSFTIDYYQVLSFSAGSLIIPMDTDYQDSGMFKAYGLVYELLSNDIPVYWSVKGGKLVNESDFTISSTDYKNGTPINNHGYRGGPFIVASDDAAAAEPLISSWQAANPDVAVHVAAGNFEAPVANKIDSAPKIAVFADGSELIAFRYLNTAGIPDSTGQTWPSASDPTLQYTGFPDVLSPTEVAGLTYTDHMDGALFNAGKEPVYTHILVMHWTEWLDTDAAADLNNESVAEIREFLAFPTHLVACCRSVIAIENSLNGKFLTANGLVIGTQAAAVQFSNSDYVFAQIDGGYTNIAGSVPSFSLQSGGEYYDNNILMIKESGTAAGTNNILIAGYIDGLYGMNYSAARSSGRPGKICYFGGHSYSVTLPISTNANSRGTRLFLNSLFDVE